MRDIDVSYRLQAVEYLREAGIPCRAVLDSAVGYIMDKVDMVFVGAEGVVENGGVINKVRRGKETYIIYVGNNPMLYADRHLPNCIGC